VDYASVWTGKHLLLLYSDLPQVIKFGGLYQSQQKTWCDDSGLCKPHTPFPTLPEWDDLEMMERGTEKQKSLG